MDKAKYIVISEKLEEAITSGVYKNRLPGIYKLSEHYETTHRTMSKALRLLEEKGLVSVNGTRGTFISAVNNFRKYRVIGVVGHSHYGPELAELEAIEKVASEFRYHVVVLANNTSFQNLLTDFPDFLFKFPADGYIFTQSLLTNKLATVLRSNGITFISLNQIVQPVGISWVDYNAEDNLLQVLNKVKSYGHRRIAYVEFKNLNYQYSERIYRTYQKFLSQQDGFNEEFFFSPDTNENYVQNFGTDFFLQLAKDAVKWLMCLKNRPTVVVVLGEKIADFMIKELKNAGVRVPEDLSIVTYLDNETNKHLAGMYVNGAERAAQASQILLNQIKYQECSVVQKFIDSKFINGPSLTRAPAEKVVVPNNMAYEASVF